MEEKETRYFDICALMLGDKSNFRGTNINSFRRRLVDKFFYIHENYDSIFLYT